MRNTADRMLLTVLACALFTLGVICGCSDRLVDSERAIPLKITVDTRQASPKLLSLVSLYRAVVTSQDMTDTLAVEPLTLNGAYLEGEIDSLPAGEPLILIVEAMEGGTGLVIYRGAAEMVLVADETVTVEINLTPQVPLMKFTPRYVLLEDSAAFSIEARVFNVEELYGVSFRVFWNDEIMAPDSTTLGGGLPTSEVIFFDTVDVDTVLGRRYHAIAITQTVTGNALVDSDGHANLARLYFTRRPFSPAGTDSIYFELTGMTRTDQTDIPLDSVYTDDCMVEIPPDTTAFAAER